MAILALLEAGLWGFVPSGASDEHLVSAIGEAVQGELQLPPRITAALVARLRIPASGRSDASIQPQLTARESEIVGLLGQGLSNKEIASRLAVEAGTVKNHVHHILEKLSVHRRGEAVPSLRGREPRLGLIGSPKGSRRDPRRVPTPVPVHVGPVPYVCTENVPDRYIDRIEAEVGSSMVFTSFAPLSWGNRNATEPREG